MTQNRRGTRVISTDARFATAHGRQPAQRYRAVVLVDITPRIDAAGAKRILGFMAAHPGGFATLEEASARIADYTGRARPDRLDGLAQVLRRDPASGRWHWDQASSKNASTKTPSTN